MAYDTLINTLKSKFREVILFTRGNIPKEYDNFIGDKGDGLLIIRNNGSGMIFEINTQDTTEHIIEVIDECFG